MVLALYRFLRVAALLAITLGLPTACKTKSGCEKDADCKGDRVCVAGECRAPNTTVLAPGETPKLPEGVPAKQSTSVGASTRRAAVKLKDPKKGPAVVRSSPKFDAAPLGTMFDGTQVLVVRESDDTFWALCRYPYPDGNSEGWIHKDILRFE